MWEQARQGPEEAEVRFCEYKGLNMSTLRVTWEAKNQLQQILTSIGFPEETMIPLNLDNMGPDPKLDVVMALMCYGLYPNVCCHKEKRKVGTSFFFFVSLVCCKNLNILFFGRIVIYIISVISIANILMFMRNYFG